MSIYRFSTGKVGFLWAFKYWMWTLCSTAAVVDSQIWAASVSHCFLLQKRLSVFQAQQQTAVAAWWNTPQYQPKSHAVKFDKQKDERLTVWGPDTQLLLHSHCLAVVAASSLAVLCEPEDEDSLPPAECTASRQKEEVKEKEGSSKSQGGRNQILKSEWVGQTLPLPNATAQLFNIREMQWF